jgi:probable HAF family extracellular repeat protein
VHGFLYYGGNYYKVGYPGGQNVTYAYGINGVGQIAGLSAVNSVLYAFIHSIKPPSWDADYLVVDYLSAYPSAFDLSFSGITNNDQVAGWVHDNSGFESFLYHENTFDPVIYPGPGYTFAYGANDAGQVVGYYSDSANNTHGFLAVPQ